MLSQVLRIGVNYKKMFIFKCILLLVTFKITTGEEFIKHAYKTLGKKTQLLIDFQKLNLQKSLEKLDLNDELPLLIYVHKNDHKLTPHILKDIVQDPEIAKYIVNFSLT